MKGLKNFLSPMKDGVCNFVRTAILFFLPSLFSSLPFGVSGGGGTEAVAQTPGEWTWMHGAITFNPPAVYGQLNITNASLGGNQIAVRGISERGTTSGNPGYSIGVQGLADAQNQDAIGVQGYAFTGSTYRAGGYFEALK